MGIECPECGKDVAEGKRFCPFCGFSFMEIPLSNIMFSRYRVLREINRKGFLVWYVARDDETGENVIIEVLEVDSSPSREEVAVLVQGFNDAVQQETALSHSGIMSLLDSGVQGDSPFVVMEYLQTTLADMLAEGPCAIEKGVDIITQILSALGYANAVGVIHGCLAPENIFLALDNTVKITGFGMANFYSADVKGLDFSTNTTGYESPELIERGETSIASDLFSVGAILYLITTGTAPFGSGTPEEIANRILHEYPAPANSIDPDVPQYVVKAIARAMAKNASVRYDNISEMRDGLVGKVSPGSTAMVPTIVAAGPVSPAEGSIPSEAVPALSKPKGKKKIPLWGWLSAAGVAVLITIVVVLLVVWGGGESTNEKNPDSASKDQEEAVTTQEPSPPQVVDLTGQISSVVASSQLKSSTRGGALITYGPNNLIDGNKDTCWAEGVKPGYGVDEWVQFLFSEPVVVTEVKAIPGYDKVQKKDRWQQNGKLHVVSLTFSDGTTRNITFEKLRAEQIIPIGDPVETTSVKVTIVSAYPGEGPEPAEDTSVSEFTFRGYTGEAYKKYENELEKSKNEASEK